MLSSSYCREAGVRGLTRECKRLARKLATLHATDQALPSVIGVDELANLMGPAPIDMQGSHASQVGPAPGLVVTGYGGAIRQVDVGLARPLGQEPKLTLTGALGPVMQESVQTALTFVRSQLDTRQIDSKFDVHLHLPQAAIPKDGPSAGITIAIALFSAFTGRPASGKVAMTGEITLRGQVLPVGGLREKILAAKRFGYDAVLYPAMLQGEVERMSVEVLEGITLHPVSRFEEALEHSFNYAQTVSIL
jgi:ATP-dependent Lon protease